MICEICKKSFRPNPKAPLSRVRFCSTDCRKKSHYQKQKELARNDWHSPKEIVEAARCVMGGIDLDPASCEVANRIVCATKFYCVRDDGLSQPWFGRIWLNPPYGRFAPKFVQRFTELFSARQIQQGILLLATHHLTTDWIATLLVTQPIICLPPKRLHFSGSTERPAHGSVLLGIGVDEEAFERAFYSIGQIWVPYRNGRF